MRRVGTQKQEQAGTRRSWYGYGEKVEVESSGESVCGVCLQWQPAACVEREIGPAPVPVGREDIDACKSKVCRARKVCWMPN